MCGWREGRNEGDGVWVMVVVVVVVVVRRKGRHDSGQWS